MADLIAWLQAHAAMIFAVLFGISEALALIPGIASNSVFQSIVSVIKALKPKDPQP